MSPTFRIRLEGSFRLAAVSLGRLAALVAVAALLAAAGCAKPRAETLVAGPPLDVPAPPPRVLAPVEFEVVPVAAGVPPSGAPELAPTGAVDTTLSGSTTTAPPARAPTVSAGGPPASEAASTAEPLRDIRVIVPSAEDAAAEKRLVAALNSARRDLHQIDPDRDRLSENAREHYAQARRHIEMAEQAQRDRNITYALHLAQAAATVASQLVAGRR
jgi:hypothetical protein